jgi:hypothetical protein
VDNLHTLILTSSPGQSFDRRRAARLVIALLGAILLTQVLGSPLSSSNAGADGRVQGRAGSETAARAGERMASSLIALAETTAVNFQDPAQVEAKGSQVETAREVKAFNRQRVDRNSPTASDFAIFNVKGYDGGQFLEWQTSREIDNLGFNLYRDDRGKRTKLNTDILAGSALVTGQGIALSAGKTYAWWDDKPVSKGTEYWLEEVDLYAESKWHGPAEFENVGGMPPSQSLAETLSKIGNPRGQVGATRPVERTASLPRSISATVSTPTSLASQPAVKISVKLEGLYKVTQPQLIAAGLNPAVDPHLLQLFVDGQQQPIKVVGEADGTFDPADWIEFYGVGLDVLSTDTRVYWLVAGTQAGLRMNQLSAGGSGSPSGSFAYTVERKDRTIYYSALLNGEADNFFGAVISASPVDQLLTLQHVDTGAVTNATVTVALQGVTIVSHSVDVKLNGVSIGQVNFDFQNEGITSFSVAHSLLAEGQNLITLNRLNGSSDLSLVHYIRINYRHTFNADTNALRLQATAGQVVSLGGFSNSQIRVLDVTDQNSVQELIGTISGGGSNFNVTLTPPGSGQRTLLAIASDQVKTPAGLTANQPSSWRVPARGADFLIVSYKDFAASIDPLRIHRQSQGLSVSVVDIEDVYDEFSFGQRTPQALKDFLQYTRTTWKKKPRFALFVGDSSWDPRNYLGAGDFDFVPSKLIDTVFMETSSDDWFADFDGDGIPELALGRFPVDTAQEAALLVQKTFNYEKSTRPDGVLLVADTPDIFDFEGANSILVTLLPSDVSPEVINRQQLGDPASRSQILTALNVGQRIVNYTGHGNVDQWRGNILQAGDGAALINDRHLSLFVLMTCLNGYFNDPFLPCIAEGMLKAPVGGAAAVWASTGQCGPFDQAITNQEFYRLIFKGDPMTGKPLTLGEAAVKAKRVISDMDVRRTWVLFGDPTMRFK